MVFQYNHISLIDCAQPIAVTECSRPPMRAAVSQPDEGL